MKRKSILAVTGALALTLMLASAAVACTVFRGTFTLKGNKTAGRVVATGLGTSMTQSVDSGVATATQTNGSIKVWAGKTATGTKLPANTYLVRYYNSQYLPTTGSEAGYRNHTHWQTDCMVGGPGTTLGSVTVASTGKIVGQPVSFSIGNSPNKDVAPEESAVCISDAGAAFGNMAPLTIA